jgi:regulator of replication initiation timing
MRWTILAVPALCLLIAGCQQNNNDEVLKKLAELEAKQKQGSDDAFKTWLMNQGQGGAMDDRVFTTFRDDMKAELEKISQSIKDTRSDNKKQIDDLDARVQKFGNIEANIGSLKTMVESLESKVKAVDPNEALKLYKDLFAKDFELQAEQKAHQAALKTIEDLKSQLATVQKELEDTKQEIVGLTGEDISKHPQYREAKRALAEAEGEAERARTDYKSLKEQYDALVEQWRKGSGSAPTDPPAATLEGEYDFVGEVNTISLMRSTGQNVMIVTVKKGRIPPINAEVLVLDARNNRLCSAKVITHYHAGDNNPDLPVDELGCQTIDAQASKPPNKGDTIVWKEPKDTPKPGSEPKGNAGGE